MAKRYLVGVDIGTQGTKCVVTTLAGQVIGSAFQEYAVEQPRPSWAEQWPQVWEEAVYQTVKAAIERARIPPHEVAGICTSGLYGGAGIPVDRNFEPLRPCIIWMDRRAIAEVQWIEETVDLDELFERTGNYVDTYFGYTKILWIKRNEPHIWKRVQKFIPPTSYIALKLTGRLAIDYSSAGNLGGIFNIHELKWSEQLCDALGIPIEMMVEKIVPSTEVVGEVTAEASRKCGLAPGTPVIAGGVDAPMATLSAGAIEPGDNVAMMGTSTCWGVVHQGKAFSKKLVSMPNVINPTEEVYTWGGSATSGALIRWFCDHFGNSEVEAARRLDLDPYQLFDMQAQKIPAGSNGLVVLPYFMGERAPLWDPDARGTVLGLTLYHTKAHLFRALTESAAYSLRQSIEIGETIGLHLKDECCVVGGVSRADFWTQILADVTGRKMLIPSGGVGAPLGDALLVGIGTGLIPDHRVIKDWIRIERVNTPNLSIHRLYSAYYRIYRQLYEEIKGCMHSLAQLERRTE